MSKHFERDLDDLKHELLNMSGNVEQMVLKANRSLRDRNEPLAKAVIDADKEIDLQEVRIEEHCLKILALHQPVATDLRRVATTMKVNNDLERIADLAVNVAERARCLIEYPAFTAPPPLDEMADISMSMLGESLDALVEMDVPAARRVCATDNLVDELMRQVIAELQERMQGDPELVAAGLHCFSAARHLERIGDHATNIAEDVIYLVEGEIRRHRMESIGG